MAAFRIRRLTALTATIVWGAAATAFAQQIEDEDLALVYGDKATVSLATGSRQTVRRAPSVATIITAEDIAATGATDLDEVLETVPGLHVARTASVYDSIYVMRGVYSLYNPQVLLMMNGIPLSRTLIGGKGNAWGGLPLDNVARIEIIRGPGSALYGSDAFSGAINVVTKSAEDASGTRVGLRLGNQQRRDAWLLHGGVWGPVAVAAYLRAGTTDGFERMIAHDAQSGNDALFGTQASLAPGSTHNGISSIDASIDLAYAKWRWRTGYKLRDDIETYAGVASALDPVGRARGEQFTGDLNWTDPHLAKNWRATATAAVLAFRQTIPTPLQLFPPGTAFPTGAFVDGMLGAPEYAERNLRLSASATYTGFARHNLRFGLGHDDLNLYHVRDSSNFSFNAFGIPVPTGTFALSSAPFIAPHRRKVDYFYVQDEWNFAPDWTFTGGIRHDNYSDFGATTTPRIALVWDVSLDLTAKLLYGEAFRAPSFNELYASNNPLAQGNATLAPETNRTLEAAFSWQARQNLQLNLNFFRYAMQDIIRAAANPAPAPGTTYNNIGKQHGSGLEFEAVWNPTRQIHVLGHYSYQKSIDETTGQDAGYAPRHHTYLRADWIPAASWRLSGQINCVADRQRAAGDTRPPIPDYTTADITLRSTQHGKGNWSFSASVRNLFNTDAREPSLAPGLIPNDLPLAKRTLWLQATHNL